MAQSIFRRYEKKYIITREQSAAFQELLARQMPPDRRSEYLVQNLYYDTANWDMIRASIERPLYKEKLRLRCYGELRQDSALYVELKKKYKGVVYKRRIAVTAKALAERSVRDIVSESGSQISREIDYYMKRHGVSERIYISYRRTAFDGMEDMGLRVTFDTAPRFRLDGLHYGHPCEGFTILPQDKALMEIKTFGGMPVWLAQALSENAAFPVSFSKYGVCYTHYILHPSKMERGATVRA
jgi:SPX domain protein involved in polyphosphate accumulation